VAARVVVGADGLLSRVREAWLGDGGPAFDSRVIFRWG
jgi:2-polyprenyl-6-methoxyphenol hydroxylase-like FAD-dependent oxidoreductase